LIINNFNFIITNIIYFIVLRGLKLFFNFYRLNILGIGDWGLGIGDWGLGYGDGA